MFIFFKTSQKQDNLGCVKTRSAFSNTCWWLLSKLNLAGAGQLPI
jgi:hypothetical protein